MSKTVKGKKQSRAFAPRRESGGEKKYAHVARVDGQTEHDCCPGCRGIGVCLEVHHAAKVAPIHYSTVFFRGISVEAKLIIAFLSCNGN